MRLRLFLSAVLGLAFAGMPALADQYTFTIDHCTGGCGTAPFGSVNVTQNGSSTVNVSVSLTSGDGFVSTGFPGSFAFDIIGNPTISVSSLPSGWSLVSTAAGNLQFDGFGNLDYALVCDVCAPGGNHPSSLSFDVTATGLTPASFAELSRIPPGSEQGYFVADIMGTTGNTGIVGATLLSRTTAPEPSTVLLLGTGGLFVAFSSFRRRRKA